MDSIDSRQLLQLFEMLEQTMVWIKDSQSRLMYINQYFVHQLGFNDREQLLGKNDYEFAPYTIARQFVSDDQTVLQGREVKNRLELNLLRSGEIGWFETSKFPLLDRDNHIVGTYGMSRRRASSSIPLGTVEQLENAFAYVRGHFTEDITVVELADYCCISVSALERRFRKYLRKSPKQLINEVRLEYGSHLLRTSNDTVANIAAASGFSDPNYFTRLFTRLYGCSPSEFRLRERPRLPG